MDGKKSHTKKAKHAKQVQNVRIKKILSELYERRNLEEGGVDKDGLLRDVDDVLHLLELGRQVVEVAHVDHARDLHLVQRVGGHQREVVLQGNVRAGVQDK